MYGAVKSKDTGDRGAKERKESLWLRKPMGGRSEALVQRDAGYAQSHDLMLNVTYSDQT